jgi:hypothetical protein
MEIALSGVQVEAIDNWLDEGVDRTAYRLQPMAQDWARIAKVQEELGEAIGAFIGVTGQNPRKGTTHEMTDVLDELADVAMTAILAIQHFTKDTDSTAIILGDKLDAIHRRIR